MAAARDRPPPCSQPLAPAPCRTSDPIHLADPDPVGTAYPRAERSTILVRIPHDRQAAPRISPRLRRGLSLSGRSRPVRLRQGGRRRSRIRSPTPADGRRRRTCLPRQETTCDTLRTVPRLLGLPGRPTSLIVRRPSPAPPPSGSRTSIRVGILRMPLHARSQAVTTEAAPVRARRRPCSCRPSGGDERDGPLPTPDDAVPRRRTVLADGGPTGPVALAAGGAVPERPSCPARRCRLLPNSCLRRNSLPRGSHDPADPGRSVDVTGPRPEQRLVPGAPAADVGACARSAGADRCRTSGRRQERRRRHAGGAAGYVVRDLSARANRRRTCGIDRPRSVRSWRNRPSGTAAEGTVSPDRTASSLPRFSPAPLRPNRRRARGPRSPRRGSRRRIRLGCATGSSSIESWPTRSSTKPRRNATGPAPTSTASPKNVKPSSPESKPSSRSSISGWPRPSLVFPSPSRPTGGTCRTGARRPFPVGLPSRTTPGGSSAAPTQAISTTTSPAPSSSSPGWPDCCATGCRPTSRSTTAARSPSIRASTTCASAPMRTSRNPSAGTAGFAAERHVKNGNGGRGRRRMLRVCCARLPDRRLVASLPRAAPRRERLQLTAWTAHARVRDPSRTTFGAPDA
jgi:hypothetical protein